MKSISALLLVVFISFTGIKGQTPVKVSEDSLKLAKVTLPALSVNIPEADYDLTLKAWTKELESGTKSKVVTENNEMTIFGAKVKDITSNPVNIYSKLSKLDSMLQLTVSFELKKDQYVERTSTPSEFTKAQGFLKQFSKNQYIELTKAKADVEDKKLREIEKELSSLEKEKTRLQKSIQSDNTTISNEKQNITVQNNEITTVSAAYIEHNKQLDTMAAGPAKEEKIKYIKDLDKQKKKAQSAVESSENRINKANADIDKINSEIPTNEKMQEAVNERIQKQQAVCQKYADKIKTIKSY
jgi:chromosome segregation ATPase